jgi:trehalose 6-phosphate synthase/phosphatase
MANTLINVSNRLPITLGEEEGDKRKIGRSSGGLVAALESLQQEGYPLKWIGWPGAAVEDEQEQQQLRRRLEEEHGCLPVFLTEEEMKGFYDGYSNSTVWPVLHYMPNYMRYKTWWWEQYQIVNRKFADAVLAMVGDGDLVWVHDYQLMLVPAMIKAARPSVRVGFFLHTPFPSYEVFRCLPQRGEVLSGLLGADQIGFHTFGYLRHFRSSVLRLLGIESEITRIRHGGHTTAMGVYPIGINAARFESELASPAFAEQLSKTASAHEDKQLVLSVERLDYTKGLLRRLDGIELFLKEADAAAREKVKFMFISVPSREKVGAYQELLEEVEQCIGRINGKYATVTNSPIHFIHGSVEFTELCALYASADVGMVTPLIDGMNLVAKEYVACQRPDEPGVLVLSEFAGAAEELFRALIVNPYDPRALADALHQALGMCRPEREGRMAPMRDRVMRFDAKWWAQSFISELAARHAAAEETADVAEARGRLVDALSRGQRVALFLDYDGTCREIEREPSAARPNPAVQRLLEMITGLANVDVTIISGRKAEELEGWLGSYPVGLIAEHGAAIRRVGHGQWEQLDKNVSYAWKEELLKLMRQFEATTPGSFVEQKRTSLVWHYRKADPEFGEWRAKQLTDELAMLTASEPLQVRHGRKIVEITATQVNKGAAITRLLEDAQYDLILVAGDDQTDESMYRLMLRNLLSIKVGEGETVAQYRIRTPAGFRRFLEEAVRAGTAVPQEVGSGARG